MADAAGRYARGWRGRVLSATPPPEPSADAGRGCRGRARRLDVSEFEQRVRGDALLAEGRRVVVLYSGGRDSTCLLDLAVAVAGPAAVTALHVNYGLRTAADQDERHCRRTAGELGIELGVHRPAACAPPAGNVQAWARTERYAAADRLARARDADVAAGHTATDQVETILYRLASSPSRRALLGMRPREGRLVRPLLSFTRAQTAAHCRARGLEWREDETNASAAYARNRIRRELVPALEQAHPAAQANVLTLAEILAGEAEVLDELVESVLAGRDEVALSVLRAQPPALQRLIVQRLADTAAGEPAAGVARRAADVAALAHTGTASVDLPHRVRATANRGIVRFTRTPPLRT
jgi:tRNA(Ile)-lysidine synthase